MKSIKSELKKRVEWARLEVGDEVGWKVWLKVGGVAGHEVWREVWEKVGRKVRDELMAKHEQH